MHSITSLTTLSPQSTLFRFRLPTDICIHLHQFQLQTLRPLCNYTIRIIWAVNSYSYSCNVFGQLQSFDAGKRHGVSIPRDFLFATKGNMQANSIKKAVRRLINSPPWRCILEQHTRTEGACWGNIGPKLFLSKRISDQLKYLLVRWDMVRASRGTLKSLFYGEPRHISCVCIKIVYLCIITYAIGIVAPAYRDSDIGLIIGS